MVFKLKKSKCCLELWIKFRIVINKSSEIMSACEHRSRFKFANDQVCEEATFCPMHQTLPKEHLLD